MTILIGVNVKNSVGEGADPVADAVRAERLGFDFVSASDHPSGTQPSYELWTMLSWIAAATTRIHVATRVLGIPYRPPAMVAKMAETFDRLSGGRLILGLGGGYSDEEFRAFGLGVPSARDKVDGLRDAIRIMHGLWSQPNFSYEGRIYHTEAAPMEPKPARRIPIWLGTYGPRALAVTGELADGWFPSLGFAPPDRIPAMRERIVAAARSAGRDPADITCAYNVPVQVDERAVSQPDKISGHPDQIVDRLRSLIGLGFIALNIMPSGPDPTEQVERIGAEVLPALHGG